MEELRKAENGIGMKYRHYVADYILNPSHQLTVSLIGCGGTGSQVLTSLGRMNHTLRKLGHPGLHVVAYDGDVVTEANCGRQLFSETEIDHNKAEVLVTKLNMFFGTQWDSMNVMYGPDAATSNIVITCVDTVKARRMVAHRLRECGLYDRDRLFYWMDYGNAKDTGQVILGTAGRSIKQPVNRRGTVPVLPSVNDICDLNKISDRSSGPSCSLAEALGRQDLFINSTLANLGMAVMWKMFTKGVLETHGAYLNLDTMRVNPIRVTKWEKC